ncbi:MAG: efflux transporter outer membrane subunit [Thiolinea sp.]
MSQTTHSRKNLAVIICILFSVAACSTSNVGGAASPAAQVPIVKSQHIVSTGTRKPIQASWWQQFGDPQLTALIQQALQNNPDISSAQASLQSARAQSSIAAAGLLPGLSAGGSARHNGDNASFSASLDASWEADIFGANRLASQSANVGVQTAQAGLEDVKASLAAEVARNYVNLRLAQARLSTAQQNLKSREQNSQLIRLRQQAGQVSGLEVDQAQLSVNQIRAQLPALQNTVSQSQQALATLTSQPVSAVQSRLKVSKGIPLARYQLANVPAEALRQRPDIRAAEYRVQAAALNVQEAKANLRPAFRLGGSLNLSSLKLTDLLDTGNLARSLLASVSAPLFDGGKLQQQVVIRDAAYQQAVAAYKKALLQAVADVANSFGSLEALRQQKPLLVQNLQLAKSAEQLAQLNFAAGRDNYQTVLDAQRTVLSSQEALLAAQADETQSMISLYKAVGGAW